MKVLNANEFYDVVNETFSHDVVSKGDILDLIEEMTIEVSVDTEKTVEQYMNEKASVSELEDFLGYPITDVVIECKDDKIKEVLSQMPEEEIEVFYNKYCR